MAGEGITDTVVPPSPCEGFGVASFVVRLNPIFGSDVGNGCEGPATCNSREGVGKAGGSFCSHVILTVQRVCCKDGLT